MVIRAFNYDCYRLQQNLLVSTKQKCKKRIIEYTFFTSPFSLKRPPVSPRHPTKDFARRCSAACAGESCVVLLRRLWYFLPSEWPFELPRSDTSRYTYWILCWVDTWEDFKMTLYQKVPHYTRSGPGETIGPAFDSAFFVTEDKDGTTLDHFSAL